MKPRLPIRSLLAAVPATLLLLLLLVPWFARAEPVEVGRRASEGRNEILLAAYEITAEKFGEAPSEGHAFLTVYGGIRRLGEDLPLYLERAESAFRLELVDGSEIPLHPLTADSFDSWWGETDVLPGEERPFELVFEIPAGTTPRNLIFEAEQARIVLPFGEEATTVATGPASEPAQEPANEPATAAASEPVAEPATAAATEPAGPKQTAAAENGEAERQPVVSTGSQLELAGDVPAVPPLATGPRNIVTSEVALAGIVAAEGHDALRDGRSGPDAPVTRVALGSPLTITFSRPWNIERLRFVLRAPEGGGYRYRLEVSADGKLWELLAARADGTFSGVQEYSFPPRPLRAVRLTATAASDGIQALEVEEFEAWSRDHLPALKDNLAWGGHGGRVLAMNPAAGDLEAATFPLINGGDDRWNAPEGASGPVELVFGFLENRAFLVDAVALRLADAGSAPGRVEILTSVEGPDRGFEPVGSFAIAAGETTDRPVLLPFAPRPARFVRLRLSPRAGAANFSLSEVMIFEARVPGYEPRLPKLIAFASDEPPAARNIALAANGGRLLAYPELADGSPDQFHDGTSGWGKPAMDTDRAVFLFRFLGERRARIDEVRLHLDDIGWPGRLTVETAEREKGPFTRAASVLLPPSFDQWRAVRFAPVEGRFLRIVFEPAREDGGREVIDEIAVLEAEAPDYLSILEVPYQEQLPLGPNLALALLGGEVVRASAVEEHQGWSPRRLIDGLVGDAYGGARGSVGWTTPPDPDLPVELDLRLAGSKPARIIGVGLNPSFKFKSSGILDSDFLGAAANRPREVEILTSLDGKAWETVGTFEMRNRTVLQTFAFPAPREARFVRFRLLSNYGGDRLQLGEIEAYEDPAMGSQRSVLADRPLDIARPELGGAVVAFTSQYSESWIGRLFDGEPKSFWSPDDGWRFPQRIRLAFAGDAAAEIAALEIVPREGGEEEARPKVLRLRRGLGENPAATLEQVGEYTAPETPGVWRIPFDPPLRARFLELSILDNFGSRHLNIGDIRVIEAKRAGYRSVLARAREEELARIARARSAVETAALLPADRNEKEPNDSAPDANPLRLGESIAGRIDPVGERDHFRLRVPPEAARPLLLDLTGEPRIKTRLEIEDKGGAVTFALDPASTGKTFRGSLDLDPGSYLLRLFEPKTRIVLLVDVSGSMEERIADARQAVLHYAASVQPQEEMAILKFSSGSELLHDFSSDGEALVASARGAIEVGGGTALYDALAKALDMLEGYAGNRAIVLLSDGADGTSKQKYTAIRKRLAAAGVRFYSIALGEGMWTYSDVLGTTPGRALAYFARSTGGRRYLTPSSSELLRLYEEIARELRAGTRYRLRLAPSAGEGQLVLRQTGERIAGVGTPDKLLFIFDASGSMRGRDAEGKRKIEVARAVLKRLVASLPEEVRIGLRVYGHRYPRKPKARSCTDSQLVVPFQRVDKAAFARFVDSIRPRGQTPIGLSLRQVAEDFGDAPGPKIVVLITDGEETCSPKPEDPDYPPRVVEDLLARGLDVKVNIVGFDIDKGEVRQFLTELAARTGGVFYGADNAAELQAAIEAAMRTPYEVRDLRGEVIARGTLDGGPVRVPAGVYRVEVAATKPLVLEHVAIEAGRATFVEIDKEGSEIAVERRIGEMVEERPVAALPSTERDKTDTEQEGVQVKGHEKGAREARVAALLGEAEELFAAQKLTTPKGGSALDRWRAVLALDPGNAAATEGIVRIVRTYVTWADKAEQRGDLEKAIGYLRRASAADPDNSSVRMLLGIDLLKAGRETEAVREFQAARKRDPSLAMADFYTGLVYMKMKKLDAALAAFARIEKDQEYGPTARLQQAFIRLMRDEYRQAYDTAIAGIKAKGDCERKPLDDVCSNLWLAVGYALTGMERFDVIAETLRQVLDLQPTEPDLFEVVALALRKQGQEEEARAVEKRGRALSGN